MYKNGKNYGFEFSWPYILAFLTQCTLQISFIQTAYVGVNQKYNLQMQVCNFTSVYLLLEKQPLKTNRHVKNQDQNNYFYGRSHCILIV